ncbi:hypothetical protein R1sor_011821 [Riccia sorocarpa]|uniref:DUF427 domain-containing protein n=1 Tax=Riccia sorocarpa TaxID=122646 RepID=A0ABD3I5V5_9MARC
MAAVFEREISRLLTTFSGCGFVSPRHRVSHRPLAISALLSCFGDRDLKLRVAGFIHKGERWHWNSGLSKREGSRKFSTVMASVVPRDPVGPGQESVWDYPRPPRMEPVKERIKIIFNDEVVADSTNAYRVLETSHPPVYYIPSADVKMEHLAKAPGSSFCEWKGDATWWTLSVGSKTAENVAWSYEDPTETFLPLKGYLAFYAAPMDACYVGEEKAQPQPGNFYGGWVTSKVVGPFKGSPGTFGW